MTLYRLRELAVGGAGCLKAAAGLALMFLVHLPRGVYFLLTLSYSAVFKDSGRLLTASPKEHLRRASLLLKKDNSHLLYAALELRFALERMVQHELILAEKATERSIQEADPIKN